MKLKEDFVERLKNIFLSKGIEDMEEDDYIVFSKIYNNYKDDTREGV